MIPIRYNTRNLLVRWKTTLLTAVGFMLVVALLTVMLAFVEGLNALSKKTGPEGNIIILQDGTTDELFSGILVEDAKTVLERYRNHPALAREGGEPLVSLEVYTIATQEIPPQKEGERATYRFLQVRGIEDPELSGKVHGLTLKEGRWFNPSGLEVVMGEGIAGTIGVKLGDKFNPRPDVEWHVVGILDSRGSPFDSEIWGKRVNIGKDFGRDNPKTGQQFYTSAVTATNGNEAFAAEIAKEIRGNTEGARLNAMTERKYYEEMSKSNQMFLGAAVFISFIMAIGGMFGLMNTMFAAVAQRSKDIGVLRIVGYRKWQILICFLIESLLLAAIGGALGLAIGSLIHGAEQTSFVSSGQGGGGKTVVFEMIVNPYVIRMGLTFTLVMGFLGGLVPAWSAMRVRPLESLR